MSEDARDRYGIAWIYGVETGTGFARRPDYIHTGMNSGFQALHLAATFGASRITLLGYDFQRGKNGEIHHHGNHPKGLGNGGRYASWIESMGFLARDLNKYGFTVLNASRRTALDCFVRVALESALYEKELPPGLERSGNDRGVSQL